MSSLVEFHLNYFFVVEIFGVFAHLVNNLWQPISKPEYVINSKVNAFQICPFKYNLAQMFGGIPFVNDSFFGVFTNFVRIVFFCSRGEVCLIKLSPYNTSDTDICPAWPNLNKKCPPPKKSTCLWQSLICDKGV